MRDDGPDLFGYEPPPKDPAKRAKREAMERVARHADEQWMEDMFCFTVLTARKFQFFTADDVWDLAEESGITSSTHEPRAFGPIMLRAAKAEVCRKANTAPLPSRRPTLHASPRQVWESLVWQ